jgi:hypothetical protein
VLVICTSDPHGDTCRQATMASKTKRVINIPVMSVTSEIAFL